jgi:hypothetical protein
VQDVIACAAIDCVIAIAAVAHVIAIAQVADIVAGTCVNDIVTKAGIKGVVFFAQHGDISCIFAHKFRSRADAVMCDRTAIKPKDDIGFADIQDEAIVMARRADNYIIETIAVDVTAAANRRAKIIERPYARNTDAVSICEAAKINT